MSQLYLKRAVAVPLLLGLIVGPIALAQQPALPEGLNEKRKEEAPSLPPGLGEPSGPALPEGLETPKDPALPPGLEQDASAPEIQEGQQPSRVIDRLPIRLNGYWESRAGVRTQRDPAQSSDFILGETRLQLETEKFWERLALEITSDFYADAIEDGLDVDLRQFRFTWTPLANMDVRIGRQVLTWGTGDMLFINDLFPKDWVSFFSGRDTEYLKAPSDAIKIGWYAEKLNLEFVYTPQFAPDRFITGERISYWDPMRRDFAGEDRKVKYNAPSDWFEDDEYAMRAYTTVGAYELAAYAYSGYWKSPGGQRFPPFQATFPKLNVYGASVRGPIGKGIGNLEVGYYDSRQDRDGSDAFVNNSELRLLVGYEREIGKEFTGAIQYYVEHMMDYDSYREAIATRLIGEPRDENRHVVTLRLTKLLMDQRMTLSMFTYYSPSDNDAYMRPKISYKLTDAWLFEVGANIFAGSSPHTFFGQFEDNSNVYAGVRFSF